MSKSGVQHYFDDLQDHVGTVCFSDSGDRLLVTCWDSHIYVYKRQHDASADDPPFARERNVNITRPVLSACFGLDEDQVFCSTMDGDILFFHLNSEFFPEFNQDGKGPMLLSEHTMGAHKVVCSPRHRLILSISWDGTMNVHVLDDDMKIVRVRLPAKPFAITLSANRAVVAMAERKVSVFALDDLVRIASESPSIEDPTDIKNQEAIEIQPWQDRISNLKFMARDLACNPDGSGFATSSIEGRVSVEYFDAQRDEEKYAFKCHRQTVNKPATETEPETKVDVVYPVNGLSFHPTFGTFATGGGDGAVAIWDANTKRRVRQYKELGASVNALTFSPDGKFLAIAVSPGWEDGMQKEEPKPDLCGVIIRTLGENEAKGKVKGSKE